MDFDQAIMERQGWGGYEQLDPVQLPPVYIAYRTDLSEGTEVFHNDIRGRYDRGEPAVVEAMAFWADLAAQVKGALGRCDWREIGDLLDSNFDKRKQIYRISDGNLRLVEAARSVGASAKFSGSGGAIVGTYEDEAMYSRLESALRDIGVVALKPQIVGDASNS
jgi:glucuronokinase